MQDKKNTPVSKDEIIAEYNKNTGASAYQPEEVSDIANANVNLELDPQNYNAERLMGNIRNKAE